MMTQEPKVTVRILPLVRYAAKVIYLLTASVFRL